MYKCFKNSAELNQNHTGARLYPGEFLLDILHDDPDGLLAKSPHLGEGSLVFGSQSLPRALPGGDEVQDSGETGQELGGTVASHLGPGVRPAPTLQVAGGQQDGGGQLAGAHCPVPRLTTQALVNLPENINKYLFKTEIQYSAGQLEDDLPFPPDNLAVVVEEHHGGGLPQLPLECLHHLLLHPGQVGLGVDTSRERQEEVRPGGNVLLHLCCQQETDETQQLDLLHLKVDLVEDEVKVGHRQVECLVAERQILLHLRSG